MADFVEGIRQRFFFELVEQHIVNRKKYEDIDFYYVCTALMEEIGEVARALLEHKPVGNECIQAAALLLALYEEEILTV